MFQRPLFVEADIIWNNKIKVNQKKAGELKRHLLPPESSSRVWNLSPKKPPKTDLFADLKIDTQTEGLGQGFVPIQQLSIFASLRWME